MLSIATGWCVWILGSQGGLCWLFSLVRMVQEKKFYFQDSFEFREAGMLGKVQPSWGKRVTGAGVVQYMVTFGYFMWGYLGVKAPVE